MKKWPLCGSCRQIFHIDILAEAKKFSCGHTATPPHVFDWKMCGKCAEKLGVCARCGEPIK